MRNSRFLLATGPREFGNSSLTLVDDLFTGLNGGGVDAQGYADGICILGTVADLDKGALRRLEGWCWLKGFDSEYCKTRPGGHHTATENGWVLHAQAVWAETYPLQ